MAKKKRRLPKRIAGVKAPKWLRKGPLADLLTSRTGQALLAEAIMAAGAVGVAKQSGNKQGGDKSDGGDETGEHMTGGVVADALRRWQGAGRGHGHGHRHEIDPMGATVAFALGEAARTFVRTVNERRQAKQGEAHGPGDDASQIEAEWQETADAPDGSKKKPARSDRQPA